MNVAQPALTYHVHAIEEELGVGVFARTSRGVTLTEAGRILLRHAYTVLEAVEAAEMELRQFATAEPRRELILGMIPSVSKSLTGPLIAAFEHDLSNVELRIVEIHARHAGEMVASGRVDAVITLGDQGHATLKPIFSEQLFLVSAAGGPVEVEVSFTDLAKHRLILPVGAGGVRLALEEIALRLGLHLNVVAQIDGVGSRKQAVLAGIGETVLPWPCVADEHASGILVATPIVGPVPKRWIVLDARTDFDPDLIASLRAIVVGFVDDMRLIESAGALERRETVSD